MRLTFPSAYSPPALGLRPITVFGLGLTGLEVEATQFGTDLSFWQLANTEMRWIH